MAYQNINQYNFNKWYLIDKSDIQDFSLASDEKNYKDEVIFSRLLIGEEDGTKLPFNFDLNNPDSNPMWLLEYEKYNPENNLISLNVYNPNNDDLYCYSAQTSCDIGLTGIDNGLVDQMTGETIVFTQGLLPDLVKFDRLFFDRRLKLHQITGHTWSPNKQFETLTDKMLFDIVSKQDYTGIYHDLYGGFYQGFYKLFGYDYELFPDRVNKGWSVEMLIKPRFVDEYPLNPGETRLNNFYPDNKDIFFYFGTRAENKFYHHADGVIPTNGTMGLNGTWEFYVQDFYGGDSGSIDSLSLTICDSNGCHVFSSNQSNILIPSYGPASVFPITFTVTGLSDTITNVGLTLNNYYHTYAGDVGMLLITPKGQPTIIAGTNGNGELVDHITVTLDSSATTLWNEYSGGTFINDPVCYYGMSFSSPCPYQYNDGDSTDDLSGISPDWGMPRVTSGLTCLETCACCNPEATNSRCIFVYPPRSEGDIHDPHLNYGCNICNGSGYIGTTGAPCSCNCEPIPICGWECKPHNCPETNVTTTTTTSDTTTTTTTTIPVPEELLPITVTYSTVSIGDACSGTTTTTLYAYTTCHNYIVTNNAFNILGCTLYQDAAGTQPALTGFYITPTTLLLIVGSYDNGIITGVTGCPLGADTSTKTISSTSTVTTSDCNSSCNTCTTTCNTCYSCGDGTGSIENTCETDPLFDAMSNAIAFKLCGEPNNPKIGVRILRFTGDCATTGSCSTTGITYTTGYTIDNLCTPNGIYDFCVEIGSPGFLSSEHWIQLDFVWERYTWFDKCELWYNGGLGTITKFEYLDSLAGNSVSLISPPITNGCKTPSQIELVNLNQTWLDEKDYRNGRLKIYVNGRIFYTFENIEEIIPRALNTDKEKQVGVPFNISWGGGTQGLHNNLTFTGCPTSLTGLTYQQDPECLPNNILSGSSYSELKTNIILEQNFGGSFDGGISQFRMYTEPLTADEIKHNFLILKDKFDLFSYDCPDCCLPDDFTYEIIDSNYIEGFNNKLGRNISIDERDKNYLISENYEHIKSKINRVPLTPTPTRTSTLTKSSVTPTPTKTKIFVPTPTKTSTPTSTPTLTKPEIPTSKYWQDNIWWGDQGSTPKCVGYAWAHWIEDGPILHSGIHPVVSPDLIYSEAQKIDEWPGENYNGTSVRAGARYLKNISKISSYYWAFDVNTLINTVLTLGPVVVGTNWYYGMFYPNINGLIKISGYLAGGHAYVINGVDTINRVFRIKNSWGQRWGIGGHAFISFDDMARLISESGEICLAIENNF